MKKTTRCDFWEIFDGGTQKLHRTDEGYLIGRAVVTNVGVFPYRKADGSIVHEFRPPQEVFKKESMDSLVGKVITLDHPDVAVTPENYSELSVGSIGDGVSRDEYHLVAPLSINRTDAVASVETKSHRALSCGYEANSVEHEMRYVDEWTGEETVYPCPGVFLGMRYDRIQTDIIYNHVALVNRGRAGDAAVLRMDGAMTTEENPPEPRKDVTMTLKKLKLDNELEYEVPQEVAAAYGDLAKKVVDSASALEKAKTEHADAVGALKAQLDSATEKADEAKKLLEGEPARVDAAVKSVLVLRDAAAKVGVELKGDESPRDIKVAVIKVVSPKAKTDGADDAYINQRFDIAMEDVDAGTFKVTKVTDETPPKGKNDQALTNDSVDDAKTAYHKSLRKE